MGGFEGVWGGLRGFGGVWGGEGEGGVGGVWDGVEVFRGFGLSFRMGVFKCFFGGEDFFMELE